MMERSEIRKAADAVLAGRDGTGQDDAERLWELIVDLGWPLVGIPQELGGAGGSLADLVELVEAVGYHAAPAPLISATTSAWVHASAHLPGDPLTPLLVGPVHRSDRLAWVGDSNVSGTLWGLQGDGQSTRALVYIGDTREDTGLLDLTSPGVTIHLRTNVAEEPRIDIELTEALVEPLSATAPPWPELQARLTLLQLAATRGAIDRAVDSAIGHVKVREQFGRRLSQLPVVQDRVAELAIAQSAAHSAMRAAMTSRRGIAAAAVVVRQASDRVAEIAHQLLGAIGTTEEHELHRVTTRLWAWQEDAAHAVEAATQLGAAAIQGSQGAWELTTEG